MRLDELFVMEAPIGDIHLYGDMGSPGSLRADDRGIVTSPKGQDKIKRVLDKAPILIDLHLVNLPYRIELSQHLAQDNIGNFSQEDFERKYGFSLKINPHALNLVYVENEGSDRLPLTPWIIAHRLSHALFYSELSRNLMIDSFGNFLDSIHKIRQNLIDNMGNILRPSIYTDIAKTFGTTKACRESNLIQEGEWFHECFAQFCITGKVKFNIVDDKLQNYLKANRGDAYFINETFVHIKQELETVYRDVLQRCVGSILVM